MKRAKLSRRLPLLLTGGLLAGILAASFTVLPALPAHAANQYLKDFSLAEDLSFKGSYSVGEKKELSEEYETEDSNRICEKLKSEYQRSFKEHAQENKRYWGIINQKVDNCRFEGSLFFIDTSGKHDEKLLKKATSESALKIKNKNELEDKVYIPISGSSSDLEKIAKKENTGIQRYTFPGKIKRVTPDIGKISGNTWTLDKPLTSAERDKLARSDEIITFTAERYGSKLWLILGITIPAALIITAIIVLLIVRNNRKKKQQTLPPYQAGYGTYPASPYTPGNSGQPTQSPFPGSPNAPGTAHKPNGQPPAPGNTHPPTPGASPQGGYPSQYGNFPPAPYPPHAPQGQPVAMQGGTYPHPYPYPPANPQNPGTWNSPMPNQGYGVPAPGFPPPQAPTYPGQNGQSGKPWHSEQSAPGVEEENRTERGSDK